MKKLVLFTLIFLFIFLKQANAIIYLNNCSTLNIPNEYYILTNDISQIPTVNYGGGCFNISADNITLDCNNHIINSSGSNNAYDLGCAFPERRGDIFFRNRSNILIKNCIFLDDKMWGCSTKIAIEVGNNITVKGSTFISPIFCPAIWALSISNSTFDNITIYGICSPFGPGGREPKPSYCGWGIYFFCDWYCTWTPPFACSNNIIAKNVVIKNSKFINLYGLSGNSLMFYFDSRCRGIVENVTIYNNMFSNTWVHAPNGTYYNTTVHYGKRIDDVPGTMIGGNYWEESIYTDWVDMGCDPNKQLRNWTRNLTFYGYSNICNQTSNNFCSPLITDYIGELCVSTGWEIPQNLTDYHPYYWNKENVTETIQCGWIPPTWNPQTWINAGLCNYYPVDPTCPPPPPTCKICDVSAIPTSIENYPIKFLCLFFNLFCNPIFSFLVLGLILFSLILLKVMR
jgi:hypothetical protein